MINQHIVLLASIHKTEYFVLMQKLVRRLILGIVYLQVQSVTVC
jgi:hypothetical protein